MAKSKRKKNQPAKRVNRLLVGTIVSWIDEDPLGELLTTELPSITHKNPVYNLTVVEVAARNNEWLTSRQAFHWLITIEAHCNDGEKDYINESYELEAVCRFSDINDTIMETVEKMFESLNIDHYRHFRFISEIKKGT